VAKRKRGMWRKCILTIFKEDATRDKKTSFFFVYEDIEATRIEKRHYIDGPEYCQSTFPRSQIPLPSISLPYSCPAAHPLILAIVPTMPEGLAIHVDHERSDKDCPYSP
jgi:hypothetical protein